MPLPVSRLFALSEAVRFAAEATGESEERVRTALIEAGLAGTVTATGCLHLSVHPKAASYFAHPVLDERTIVPTQTWGAAISWPESRVGRYDLVRFHRVDIERWLAWAATERQSGSVTESQASEPEAIPSGTRTNRAAAAEEACHQWLSGLKARPANKDTAFEAAKAAVKRTGPLSRKAFERAWATTTPADWKRGGRPKKSSPRKI